MDVQVLKDLREKTGAGFNDVKAALDEAGGDVAQAQDILRKKGQAKAAKKGERDANEGFIGVYVHSNGKIASLVSLQCETDFVARNEGFQTLAKDLAMHVASEAPQYLSPEDVPAELIEKEKEVYIEQLKNEGKPEAMFEKILPGKVAKFYSDVCLMEQNFIKDDKKKIKDLISDAVLQLGENIKITKFERLSV